MLTEVRIWKALGLLRISHLPCYFANSRYAKQITIRAHSENNADVKVIHEIAGLLMYPVEVQGKRLQITINEEADLQAYCWAVLERGDLVSPRTYMCALAMLQDRLVDSSTIKLYAVLGHMFFSLPEKPPEKTDCGPDDQTQEEFEEAEDVARKLWGKTFAGAFTSDA